jgi:RNA polymerase sigma factor (sigma-70 family)
MVRIPPHSTESIRALEKCYEALGKDAPDADVLAHLGWGTLRLEMARMAMKARRVLELDAPIAGHSYKGEDYSALADFMAAVGGDPAEEVCAGEVSAQLDQAINKLTPRQAQVVRTHIINEQTLAQTGRLLKISRERARRLEIEGIRALRTSLSRLKGFKGEVFS